VVLQPSARLTRSRMAHRVVGTVAGALTASLPVWAALPVPWLLTAIAACCAVFTYLMRRHYGTAVFFITVTVILMTGLDQPLSWQIALERLGCVVVGSLSAWLAARALWPGLSVAQFEAILQTTFEADRAYLAVLRIALASGGNRLHWASVEAKRRAERAGKRLADALADFRDTPGAAADGRLVSLADVAPRLTGMLTVLFLQQEGTPPPLDDPEADELCRKAMAALTALAGLEPSETGNGSLTPALTVEAPTDGLSSPDQRRRQDILGQLRDIVAALAEAEGQGAPTPGAACAAGSSGSSSSGRLDAANP
jgi:hypothetical protein